MEHYNHKRKHRSLKYNTPMQMWEQSYGYDSTDRRFWVRGALLSRPMDKQKTNNQLSIAPYSLENNKDLAQLCRSVESYQAYNYTTKIEIESNL